MDAAKLEAIAKLLDVLLPSAIKLVEAVFGARKGRSKKAAVRRTVREAVNDAIPVAEIDQRIDSTVAALKEAGEI